MTLPLKIKFLVPLGVFFLIAFGVSHQFIKQFSESRLEHEAFERANVIGESIASSLSVSPDFKSRQRIVSSLSVLPNVESIYIIDNNSRIYASNHRNLNGEKINQVVDQDSFLLIQDVQTNYDVKSQKREAEYIFISPLFINDLGTKGMDNGLIYVSLNLYSELNITHDPLQVIHVSFFVLFGAVVSYLSILYYLTIQRPLSAVISFSKSTESVLGGKQILKGGTTEFNMLCETLNSTFKALAEKEKNTIAARTLAEDSNRAKSQFLANMSHEIRTPLTSILGHVEIMSEGTLQQSEFNHSIGVIRNSGQHLLQIITDILDLSKIEAGKLEIEALPLALMDFFDEISQIFEQAVKTNNNQLHITIEPELPKFIRSDPVRLRQIILNITGNALKFTFGGKVHIRLKKDGDQLRVEIEDNGIGMTKEQVEKIFAEFSQVDNSTTRKFGGAGLGLSICERLCEVLGGKISVLSLPDKGTCFTVLLPLDEVTEEEYRSETVVKQNLEGDNECQLAAHILLVEDNNTNRMVINKMLTRRGFTMYECVNGKEATTFMMQGKADIDLILMDMQMPVMDGYSATRFLRKNGVKIPIIALTANVMPEDIKKYLDAGCDGLSPKPIKIKELLSLIHTQINRSSAESAGNDGNSLLI